MPMNPIRPGLRPMHNRTNSPARVEVIVPAGDDLEVSDDVAAQLEADGRFRDGAAPTAPEPAAEPDDEEHVCPECGKTAKSAGGLATHMRSHDAEG